MKAAPNKKPALSDKDVRSRCVAAAAKAMSHGKPADELTTTFAANLMGLVKAFHALASGPDAARKLDCIEAAATGMQHSASGSPSQIFAGEVMRVAEQFCKFATGAQGAIGHDHLAGMMGKTL